MRAACLALSLVPFGIGHDFGDGQVEMDEADIARLETSTDLRIWSKGSGAIRHRLDADF